MTAVICRRPRLASPWWCWALIPILWGTLCPAWAEDSHAAATEASQADVDQRIANLIRRLGDPVYATREKAQAELEQLGLEAFDALTEAQSSDDIEISMRARYLVRSMRVTWYREGDPARVKDLLKGYSQRPESERGNLIEQLAALPDSQGLTALCRLVRFESSEKLSKRAALFAMQLKVPSAAGQRGKLADDIVAEMGRSRRVAAEWMRTYAGTINNVPGAFERWEELIRAERKALVEASHKTNRTLTRDLLRWYADQLKQRDRNDEAVAAMRQTIDLLNGTDAELMDAVDWFRERRHWGIVASIAERFSDTFKRNAMLLYRLAESQSKLGRDDQAAATAKQALESVPEDQAKHMEIAENLQHDGLFPWAETEYRHVVKQMKEDTMEAVRAHIGLSEMLHELARDAEAAELLEGLLKDIDSDNRIREVVESDLGREVPGIEARKYFFLSEAEARRKNHEKQREYLLKGYEQDSQEVDILIAMHHLPDADEAWKQESRQRIAKAVAALDKQIADLDRVSKRAQGGEAALAKFQLAFVNNQLAWLIANTVGDYDKALRCSVRSLDLLPDRAGFLDTLGRCYYAKGDYAKAVENQAKAIELEPHSPPIRRQFELFKKALAKADEKKKGAPDS